MESALGSVYKVLSVDGGGSLTLHIQSDPSMLVFLIKFLMHFAAIPSPLGLLRGPR